MTTGPKLRNLDPADAADGLRLSRIAGWNQTLEDWEFLLTEGTGFGFEADGGLLVATMIALPLGPRHGWISMVLTDPDWRRRGFAKELMTRGIDILETSGLIPTLDATPEGETVYRGIGFAGETKLARWRVTPEGRLSEPGRPEGIQIRHVLEADLRTLADYDHQNSGCDRQHILRFLHKHQPKLALMAVTPDATLAGYIMGRSGDRMTQLGPLVAPDASTASLLLQEAIREVAAPVYVDAFDQNQYQLSRIGGLTWSRERGFTRLLKGSSTSPETAGSTYLAAGPELS